MVEIVEAVCSENFIKHFNKLKKTYNHLSEDFKRFSDVLIKTAPDIPPGTVKISDLGAGISYPIYKVKHFRSVDFKGCGSRSGFRIIYSYIDNPGEILLIDIYHKSKQDNHDRELIKGVIGDYTQHMNK